jgi:hypothetical protein
VVSRNLDFAQLKLHAGTDVQTCILQKKTCSLVLQHFTYIYVDYVAVVVAVILL